MATVVHIHQRKCIQPYRQFQILPGIQGIPPFPVRLLSVHLGKKGIFWFHCSFCCTWKKETPSLIPRNRVVIFTGRLPSLRVHYVQLFLYGDHFQHVLSMILVQYTTLWYVKCVCFKIRCLLHAAGYRIILCSTL